MDASPDWLIAGTVSLAVAAAVFIVLALKFIFRRTVDDDVVETAAEWGVRS